jgi:hypothetical protein
MSSSASIQVDAFNTNLHNAKILCQGPFPNGKFPPILDSVQDIRAPFKKRILLTKSSISLSKTLSLSYDAIFQTNDSSDWTLAITYASYCPKPALVIIEDTPIPDGVWPRITKGLTIVHISHSPVHTYVPYDAIFFAPIQDINSSFATYVFHQLQSIFRSTYQQKEYRDILQELRIAGAGLAWTRWNESSQTGSMYWYDTVSSQVSDTLSKKQLSDIFQWLAIQFQE